MGTKHLLAALACATVAAASVAAAKPAGNAAAGEGKSAACGGCHGPDGNNAPEMYAALKAPKLAGQVPEYIVKSLHDFKAARRSNEVMSPQAQAVVIIFKEFFHPISYAACDPKLSLIHISEPTRPY